VQLGPGEGAERVYTRTEIETHSGGSGDDERFQYQAACVGDDVFLQLLILSVFILQKRAGM
jgi:hypothetical protein